MRLGAVRLEVRHDVPETRAVGVGRVRRAPRGCRAAARGPPSRSQATHACSRRRRSTSAPRLGSCRPDVHSMKRASLVRQREPSITWTMSAPIRSTRFKTLVRASLSAESMGRITPSGGSPSNPTKNMGSRWRENRIVMNANTPRNPTLTTSIDTPKSHDGPNSAGMSETMTRHAAAAAGLRDQRLRGKVSPFLRRTPSAHETSCGRRSPRTPGARRTRRPRSCPTPRSQT